MKLFNTIATLGALCAITEAISLSKAGVKPKKHDARTEFTLSKIDDLASKIDTLTKLDLAGVSASKQEKMGEIL